MTLLETDDLHAWTKNHDRLCRKFEKFFKDPEQLEYFVLLPLSDEQRLEVLKQLMENADQEKKEKQE